MSNPLEKLWKDKVDVFRTKTVKVNNITKQVEEPMYTGAKCHYSKTKLTSVGTNGIPTITNTYSLFCSLDKDIHEGDKLVVTQINGKIINLKAGEGFPYSTHQEFSVTRNGIA